MTGDLTYIVTDGVLYLTYDDVEETDYEVSVSGNGLVLTNTFYQEEQIFARTGGTAEAPTAAEATAKEDPYVQLAAGIIGSWLDVETGDNERFAFKKDRTDLYTWKDESHTFTYGITDDVIEIFLEDGDYSSFYVSIEDDMLYLSGWPLERQS